MRWQNKAKILEKLNCEPAVALKKEKDFVQFLWNYSQRETVEPQTEFIRPYKNLGKQYSYAILKCIYGRNNNLIC